MRNVLADYVRKLPIDLRTYILPLINGLFGGLAAVAFQKLAQHPILNLLGNVVPTDATRDLHGFQLGSDFGGIQLE